MSKDNLPNNDSSSVELEGGAYEVLRNRLNKQSDSLREKLTLLNDERKKAFGSIDTAIITTERISTTNNCIPWDMVVVGKVVLFGYNVQFGLKPNTEVSDVISAYSYEGHTFSPVEFLSLLSERFLDDFQNLYKYYKNTYFLKFSRVGVHLYMVFRIGKSDTDVKVFKWRIAGDELEYIDARSEHEFKFPAQHEFEWVKTTRDMHRDGEHPHVSIEDEVFIEAIGGDITIKVEDNTSSGKGVFSETVENKDQSLDDADIFYSKVGNLYFFKILPFQEKEYRYIIYNIKLQLAERVDAISDACVLLPDDQGVIFSGGYYLQSGEYKLIDNDLEDMLFERRVLSPNGEDFLYVFYNLKEGKYLLLSYNIIEQTVRTPTICYGYSFFENGELAFFKSDVEPKKHHAIQIWQTPFTGADFQIPSQGNSYLQKIGNKEIVRAMAECHELLNLLAKEDSYSGLYIDVLKASNDVLDAYFWLNQEEVNNLAEPIGAIKETSSTALAEFDKVVKIRKNTKEQYESVTERVEEQIRFLKRNKPSKVNEFVKALAEFRGLRGELISLLSLRYIDSEAVKSFEGQLVEASEKLSQKCVDFLLDPEALTPYEEKVEEIKKSIDEALKVVDADGVDEVINDSSKELELLIDVVSNLKIEDATQTTAVIDQITGIYSKYNTLRAGLKQKRKELFSVEGKAEFTAQMKLISQGVINFLDLCDTAEKCNEYLTKLMVQLEELEGKFSEFDDYLDKIATKREEIYNAFEGRKVELSEAKNRKTNALFQSADRIVKAVKNRLLQFKELNEINGYLASDLMLEKARNIIQQLIDLGDSVKADDIQSRLNSSKEDAIRQLKDKKEIFSDGGNSVAFGNYQFLVNAQEVKATMVERNDEMFYHITGTNFFEKVQSEVLASTEDLWSQVMISENRKVYRAEYLAYELLNEACALNKDDADKKEWTETTLHQFTSDELLSFVQNKMAVRYNEGYVKGVHDVDTSNILFDLLQLHVESNRLRFSSPARALATFTWAYFFDEKVTMEKRLKGAGLILSVFPESNEFVNIKEELKNVISNVVDATSLFCSSHIEEAVEYIFNEVALYEGFVSDGVAVDGFDKFIGYLKEQKAFTSFEVNLNDLGEEAITEKIQLTRSWLKSWDAVAHDFTNYIDEITYLVLSGKPTAQNIVRVSYEKEILGLLGTHSTIEEGVYHLHYSEFVSKMRDYCTNVVPRFLALKEAKQNLLHSFESNLRLDEFKPKVMSSFVRNQLIDKVYLPLIGANLAKQIGAAGEGKRTDLMGMLLLISPPGYGKTTLMEYIASRLGVVFMKINGPAIGHDITSVDPEQASNASAREELEKLNLAFEMGDNVMIYLDDIQHCNPEFLQKFISLCDGQRKIEGVYKGKAKTYDFRGKKVAVIMAGNPYTESGDKFQIPDMLANRADIYNLGDIIGNSDEAFELSYIENCTSSHPILQKVASKSQKDFLQIVRSARNNESAVMEVEESYSPEELSECLALVKKVIVVRDLVLKINQEYIHSAAQAEEYRTEPPFKLQGSYRNMSKIVERLSPIMNDAELKTLLNSHYENESQTLTTGAEANMLKFRELFETLTEEDVSRWGEIKEVFVKNNKMKFTEGVDLSGMETQLEFLNTSLNGIRGALARSNDDVTQQVMLKILDHMKDDRKEG